MPDKRDRALRSIFRGGAIMFLGTMCSKFLGLLYRVLVGRYLGPADYGVISVMMAVFASATSLAFFGIHSGVQKYVAEYRGQQDWGRVHGVILSGLHLITIPSVLAAVLLFVFSPLISVRLFNEADAIWPIRFVAVAIPFLGYTKVLTNVAEGFGDMVPTVVTGKISANVIKIVLAAALVYLGYGYLGAAVGFAAGFIVASVIAYWFYRRTVPPAVHGADPVYNYRELFQFSWPLVAGSVFGIVTGYIDTFMLQMFRGSASVGLYNAAYPFAILISSLAGMFASIFLSNSSREIGEGDDALAAELYRTVVKWTAVVIVPVFLIVFVFPRTVLSFFGTEYYAVGNTLRVLSVGFLLSGLIGPASSVYQAYDRTDINLITSGLAAVSNGVANYVLIQRYGVMGAAIASTLSSLLVTLFALVMVRRFLGCQPFRRSVVKVWAAGLLAIGGVYALNNAVFSITPHWFFAVDLALFGGGYLALLLVLRTLEEEDLIILRAIRDRFDIDIGWAEALVRRFA